jgi:transposase InsO family protein
VTQIDTDEGPLYLATTEDLVSRRMLGHAMSAHHDAALVVASLQIATTVRGGDVDGVIFHTDRGSEYAAAKTAAACHSLGVVQSMGRVGCALDNAAAEAFNTRGEGRVRPPADLQDPGRGPHQDLNLDR